jgi:hypothetical protein
MSTTFRPGALVVKDPDEQEVYDADWDTEHLATGVTITNSVWTITRLSGVPTGLMTFDNDTVSSGGRTTQLRLLGGTEGQRYRVTNEIVTNETPARTKDRSFFVLIQTR